MPVPVKSKNGVDIFTLKANVRHFLSWALATTKGHVNTGTLRRYVNDILVAYVTVETTVEKGTLWKLDCINQRVTG